MIEAKIEKGVLQVSYDPLATTEKEDRTSYSLHRDTIKAAATDTEGAHPDVPAPASLEQASVKNPRDSENA